jgi:hypothetical protein
MSFFRTPIDPEVQKALFRRIEGINKSYSDKKSDVGKVLEPVGDPFENEYFKTCWARVVTIDGDGKEYYLNSQLGSDGKTPITEPLNIKKNGDYSRGRAGITSISSNFKEFFLKQSTISFLCPDPKEFEEIQDHFLKHGRYVLIEFGWSTRKNIQLEKINTDNLLLFSENLVKRTKNSRGNYTAICGVITNFNFNQKQDGSYEGTFEVSSMGRNILGQKVKTDGKIENLVQYANQKIRDDEKVDDPNTPEIETGLSEQEVKDLQALRASFVSFHATIKALPNVIEKFVGDDNNPKLRYQTTYKSDPNEASSVDASRTTSDFAYDKSAIVSKQGAAFIPNTSDLQFSRPGESKDNLAYCTWGWFEDYILNSFFAFSSIEKDDNFRTRFFSVDDVFDEQGNVVGNKSTKCKTNPNLFSTGLHSIILPGLFKQFAPDDINPETGNTSDKNSVRERALSKIIEHFNNEKYFHPFQKLSTFEQEVVNVGGKDIPIVATTTKGTDPYVDSQTGELVGNYHPGTNIPMPTYMTGGLTQGETQGNIRNMVFEANYLMDAFTNTENIEHALMRFWQKVSNDYGGFWRFGIVQDENTDGKIKIMDLNIGEVDDTDVLSKLSTPEEPNKIFKFPLYEKNSFIQDFSLETAYDSQMATMAVFGSNADMQATRGDMGQGYSELAIRALSLTGNPTLLDNNSIRKEKRKSKYDIILRNLITPYLKSIGITNSQGAASSIFESDRGYKQKDIEGIKFGEIQEIQDNVDNTLEKLRERNQYSSDFKEIRKGYFWFDLVDDTAQIYSSKSGEMLQEFKRTMLYKINKSSDEKDASNYNVVLPAVPLQLSLTIQGTGGIKIGDLFYIDYLPEVYRKYCHFMIVGVEHEISTTGWTTKLDSRMIVDIPKLIKDNPNDKSITKREFNPFVLRPGEQLRDTLERLSKDIKKANDQEDYNNSAEGAKDRENEKIYQEQQEREVELVTKNIIRNNPNFTNEDVLNTLKGPYYKRNLSQVAIEIVQSKDSSYIDEVRRLLATGEINQSPPEQFTYFKKAWKFLQPNGFRENKG